MTVSYEERDENHREPSLGGWWWVIKHFPSKTVQEPLCVVCGRALSWMRTIPENNIPHRFFWIKSNYSIHSTFGGDSILGMFWAHHALRSDKCDVSLSMGILETLRNTSAQSFIWFSLEFSFRDWSDLEEKNSPRMWHLPYEELPVNVIRTHNSKFKIILWHTVDFLRKRDLEKLFSRM